MNPKCNMDPAERERIFSRFHDRLTTEEEEMILTLFPQYLFFRMTWDDQRPEEPDFRLCTCSACGFKFEGVRVNGARGKVHDEKVTCPNCGKMLTGKAIMKFKYDMPSLARWTKTAIAWADGEGGILIEAGDAFRTFNHDCLTGELRWVPLVRYYFAPGRIQMWENRERYRGTPDWKPCGRVREPFQPSMGINAYDGDYLIHCICAAIRQSGLRYCQFEEFFEQAVHASEGEAFRYQIKYLAAAAMYPQIEMAVKWQLYKPVWELITEWKQNNDVLNWKATDPAGFLRMNKQDAKLFLQSNMDSDDLRAWKKTDRMSMRKFLQIREQIREELGEYSITDILKCAELSGETFETAARYIQSLIPPCRQNALPVGTIIRTWKDYLDMAKKLEYDLSEKTVRMPKDLQARHDAAASTIKAEENKSEREKYRKRYSKLVKKYAYRYGGLMIVVPEGMKDIIAEGRILRHCVGGYADRHIKGVTTILFLRHERRPERSFLTLEVYEDQMSGETKIRQIHGYQNEHYDKQFGANKQEQYAWFLNPWLNWVNEGSRRDSSGNPITEACRTG